MPYLGEAAALATAALFACASLLFTFASQRVGSFAVNLSRITFAVPVLVALTLLIHGGSWSEGFTPQRLTWLAASGWVGLTLGDWALFSAFALIGPRLSLLLMALAPPVAAALSFPLLGEVLGPRGLIGMVITLAGVVWVILERASNPPPRGHRVRGVVFGLLGAAGQGLGLVLSKLGMAGEIDPLPATAVRMLAALIGAWLVAAATGRLGHFARLVRDIDSRKAIAGATVLGPVLGVWLSLLAIEHAKTGIAATLMAMVPVFILPLARYVRHEQVSPRAVLGAVIAVAGVAVLVLR